MPQLIQGHDITLLLLLVLPPELLLQAAGSCSRPCGAPEQQVPLLLLPLPSLLPLAKLLLPLPSLLALAPLQRTGHACWQVACPTVDARQVKGAARGGVNIACVGWGCMEGGEVDGSGGPAGRARGVESRARGTGHTHKNGPLTRDQALTHGDTVRQGVWQPGAQELQQVLLLLLLFLLFLHLQLLPLLLLAVVLAAGNDLLPLQLLLPLLSLPLQCRCRR